MLMLLAPTVLSTCMLATTGAITPHAAACPQSRFFSGLLGCVQGVQDHIDGMAAELSKSLKKELQESGALCQAQFADLCNQLADRKAQITAKTEVYQKERTCLDAACLHMHDSFIVSACSETATCEQVPCWTQLCTHYRLL